MASPLSIWGKRLGAEVVSVASSIAKRLYAATAGADHVMGTEADAWHHEPSERIGGDKPDVIFDPVRGPLFKATYRRLG